MGRSGDESGFFALVGRAVFWRGRGFGGFGRDFAFVTFSLSFSEATLLFASFVGGLLFGCTFATVFSAGVRAAGVLVFRGGAAVVTLGSVWSGLGRGVAG